MTLASPSTYAANRASLSPPCLRFIWPSTCQNLNLFNYLILCRQRPRPCDSVRLARARSATEAPRVLPVGEKRNAEESAAIRAQRIPPPKAALRETKRL